MALRRIFFRLQAAVSVVGAVIAKVGFTYAKDSLDSPEELERLKGIQEAQQIAEAEYEEIPDAEKRKEA